MPLPKTNILFDLAKELTCDLKFPFLFAFIIETITHGQIVSIVLSPGTTFNNDSTLSWFETVRTILLIPSVFGTVNLQDYPGTIQSFWIVFVVYLICYLLCVIGIGVLSTMHQRKPWLSQSLTVLSLIHSRVFFLPIHYFLLQVIQYVQNDTAEKDNSSTFITGIGIFVATIFLILINLTLACLKEFLCYRIDRDRSNYCSKTNLYPRLALMYKVLATTILVSTSETTVTSQVISITGIIYTGAIIYILSSKLPFYDLTLLQFSHSLASATLAFSIFGFLSSLSQITNKSVLILLVMIIFLVVFFHNRLKVGFERILTAHFDTAERAIHFPILFKKYASNYDALVSVQKQFPLESLYFYNFFTANTGIYTSEELKNFKAIDLMNQEFYSRIIDRCSATRINYKKSEAFLLYMANILINKLGNTFQALTFMEEAKQAHSSIPVRVSADNLYNSLSRAFEKNMDQSSGDIVLSSYFKHRDDLNLLKTDIRTEIKHHQDLWNEIAQDKVDVKKVIDLADKIDQVHLKIAKQWARKELDFQRTYSGALMMYSFYLDILKGFPHDSIPLIRKYYTTTKNSINKKEQVISEDSVIMIASMERDKLGTVTDCSDSVLSMFGIARERLLNAKINILMPNFISAQHDKFMQRYMQSSKAQGTEIKYSTFGKSRDGSLKELELELKVYPHLDKGVNMIAYIKQLSAQSQVMIIKPDGQIAECSINLQKVLKLNSSFIENVNIKEVCPDFVKINTAFNVHYGNNEAGIQEDLTQTNFDPRDTAFNKKTDQPLNSLMEGTVGITKTKEEEALLLFSPTSPLMSPQLTGANVKIPLVKENSYPLNLARDQSYPLKMSGYGMMAKLTATDISIKPLLNEDEAKNVVEKYRDGDQLQFLPYSTGGTKRVGISFNISVTPYILHKKVYKIIRLLDIEGLEDKNFKVQEERSPIVPNNRGLDLLGKGILGYLSSAAEESHISSEVEHDVPEERSFERSETRQTDIARVKATEPQRTEAPEIKREEQHTIGNLKEDMEMKKLLTELGSFIQGQKQKQGEDQLEEVKKRVQTMMIKQSIQGSSTASLNNMNLKLIKRLNDVFNVKKTRPITRWATFAVYLVLIAIFTFAFVNLSITQPSLDRVQNGVTIIDTASRRLNRALVAWEWMLMFYSRLLGLRAFFSVYGYSRKYIFNVTTTMMQLDKNLRLEIESINNNEIRDIFLEKGIKFYDAKGVLMYPGINMDTFGATDILIIQNRFIGNYSGLDSVLVKRPEFITTINNTANGLLVASESVIKRTYDALQLIVNNSISQSKEILIFEHIGLLLLCLALAILVRVTLQAYSKVFQAITRISPSSIKSRQDQIKSFEDMLDNNMEMQTDIQRPAKAKFEVKTKKDKDKKKITSGHFMKTYRMAGLTLHLSKYIIISLCLMGIISGMFLALYLQSQSSFTSLGKASTQIYTIGKLDYQGVVVLANFYFVIIFQNYTNMYIRNQDPLVQLDTNLASLSTVNEQLLAAFSNVDDPTVYGLLNGNLCSYLTSDQQSDCSIATQGGSIALLGINSRSYSTAANYINLYKANPTTENAKQLIKPYYDLGVSLDRTTDASFTILANYILGKFNTEVTNLKQSNLLLSYGVAIVIVITTILMHSFSIKKFITLDMGQRKILKALTYNVVSQNKALGFLLKKEFKNEVQGLGRVLSV